MPGAESRAWSQFRDAMRRVGAWAERIDVARRRGVPDVWWCVEDSHHRSRSLSGWVELKAVRSDTERVVLRPEQVAWLATRAQRGAHVAVAVMTPTSWLLIRDRFQALDVVERLADVDLIVAELLR